MLLGLFAALLIGLPVLAEYAATPLAAQLAGFYRAGALVFGGGHVVLPMLESTAVAGGMVSQPDFLAGYGAAQAMPGPLFSFCRVFGRGCATPAGGWMGWISGLSMLAMIFLPGALQLLAGAMPFWDGLRRRPGVRNMLAGVNAPPWSAMLLSALYDPVDVRHPWTGGLRAGPVAVRPAGVCALVAGMGGDDGGGGRLGAGWLA